MHPLRLIGSLNLVLFSNEEFNTELLLIKEIKLHLTAEG